MAYIVIAVTYIFKDTEFWDNPAFHVDSLYMWIGTGFMLTLDVFFF